MRRSYMAVIALLGILCGVLYSCSKSDSSNAPDNPCTGATIAVTATVTNAASGQSNGSIVATATGGTGFTFRLNNGSFQSSGTFNNLAAGAYTVTARSSEGCEGSAQFTVGTSNACAGTNITVTTATTTATPCQTPANGTITVTATGSTGLTYSIDGTNFQAGNTFSNVGAGNYTVTVRNAASCMQTAAVTVAAAPAGALFSAVKAVLQTNCVTCHNASNLNGGMNWAVDCNIVANSGRIKARAVDAHGTTQQMPPPPAAGLSAADRQKITDWIAAGGRYTN
ncbi:MAG TPA: hypothetical protein VGE66_15735 [Chitinophagaceae bacterium]